jgi:type IV secretion system protein VirB8
MTDMKDKRLEGYYSEAQSWAVDRQRLTDRSIKVAWFAASAASLIAVLEALALFMLIPLKREVPYTLLVDKQTGFVQALKPLDTQTVSADAALTRSFLVQYVLARESFDADRVQENYRKVGLWSTGEARDRYQALMNPANNRSPFASLPRGATIDVEIKSISSLSKNSAMVRFSTTRTDPGSRSQAYQHWAAVVSYRYSQGEMSEADRLTNPLGFQVVRYRKDAETLTSQEAMPSPIAQPTPNNGVPPQ